MDCLNLDSWFCTGTCINLWFTRCLYVCTLHVEQETISHLNVDCNLHIRNLTYASIKSYTQSVYLVNS